MAKSLRNIKKNWAQIKRDFWDLCRVATIRGESARDLLPGAMLWGTIYAVVGTPILLTLPWLASVVT